MLSLKPIKAFINKKTKVEPKQWQVLQTLQMWQKNRTFILVQPQFSKESYQSVILHTDIESKTFKIDELFPKHDCTHLNEGQKISICAREFYQSQSFNSECVGQGYMANMPYYLLKLPSRMNCSQRRRVFRLCLKSITERSCFISTDFGEVVATVEDISCQGLGFSCESSLVQKIEVKRDYPIILCLANNLFEAKVQIRWQSGCKEQNMMTMGAKFSIIVPKEQTKLHKWIWRVQRDLKRTQERSQALLKLRH